MRVEHHHGRYILCGHILPAEAIKPGQVWAASGGATVRVSGVRDDWVGYTWEENGRFVRHEKDVFSFQCRYCLVLDGPELPKGLPL